MQENETQAETKKPWSPPEVTVYGNVEQLTQQSKNKQPGTVDDFSVNGISNFP